MEHVMEVPNPNEHLLERIYPFGCCHISRYEPKRPVETGANVCNANRHDQSMVKETGSHICQRTVGEHSLSGYGPIAYMNRPVRTRMPGGVGAGG